MDAHASPPSTETGDFPAWPFLTKTIEHGYGAVVFFFQLSGFVNVVTSERRASDYTSPSFRPVFWKRRLARLVQPILSTSSTLLRPRCAIAAPF